MSILISLDWFEANFGPSLEREPENERRGRVKVDGKVAVEGRGVWDRREMQESRHWGIMVLKEGEGS